MAEKASYTRLWSVLFGISVGVLVFVMDYSAQNKTFGLTFASIAAHLARSIIAGLLAALLHTIWPLKREVADIAVRIDSLSRQIDADERIIFARPNLSRDGRPISVVAIERPEQLPEILRYSPQSGAKRWARSISLLRFDRIQDLLFSDEYLQYFFSLRQRSKHQFRILIINDRPRSADAVRSFLRISAQFGISSFVYRKSEFYGMLDCLRDVVSNVEDTVAIREVLGGNPELNLMADARTLKEWSAGPVTPETDYVLRYLTSGRSREVVTRAPGALGENVGTMPYRHVAWVSKLLSAALRDARAGLDAFERLRSEDQTPENFWSPKNLSTFRGWEP